MGRITNTIELAKISWGVLKKDRELLIIPVLSFVSAIVVLGALLVPTIALIDTSGTGEEGSADPALVIIGIAAALSLSVISVFFNGALVAGAHERLTGGDARGLGRQVAGDGRGEQGQHVARILRDGPMDPGRDQGPDETRKDNRQHGG